MRSPTAPPVRSWTARSRSAGEKPEQCVGGHLALPPSALPDGCGPAEAHEFRQLLARQRQDRAPHRGRERARREPQQGRSAAGFRRHGPEDLQDRGGVAQEGHRCPFPYQGGSSAEQQQAGFRVTFGDRGGDDPVATYVALLFLAGAGGVIVGEPGGDGGGGCACQGAEYTRGRFETREPGGGGPGGAGGQQPRRFVTAVALAHVPYQGIGECGAASRSEYAERLVAYGAGVVQGECGEGLFMERQANGGGERTAAQERIGEGLGDGVDVAARDGEEEGRMAFPGVSRVEGGVQCGVVVRGQCPAVPGESGTAGGEGQGVEVGLQPCAQRLGLRLGRGVRGVRGIECGHQRSPKDREASFPVFMRSWSQRTDRRANDFRGRPPCPGHAPCGPGPWRDGVMGQDDVALRPSSRSEPGGFPCARPEASRSSPHCSWC